MIADAVEELLRLTSPVQGLARTATRDVTVEGTSDPGRATRSCCSTGRRTATRASSGADAEALDVERRPERILTFG